MLRFQNRYRHKGGSWRWLSWVGVPDDGKVYGSARDITAEIDQAIYLRESQAREETVQQNNRRMRTSLAAGSIIGNWNWNFQDDFLTFDEGVARAFGHDPSSAQTGLPIDQVLVNAHPEDRPGLDAAIADTIVRGGSYARQYRVLGADGAYRWIEASGRVDHDADGKASSFHQRWDARNAIAPRRRKRARTTTKRLGSVSGLWFQDAQAILGGR